MKARGPLLVFVCVLVALALPAAASGATGKTGELKISTFRLEGSNRYEVEVVSTREGRRAPTSVVSAGQGPFGANYTVQADPSAGTHATFGSLGHLDVNFERRKKEVSTPEAGCRWILEEGIFRGSFHFTGEGGYFSSEATDPRGDVLRLPNGFCGFADFRSAPIPAELSGAVLAAQAPTPSGTVSFEALRLNLGPGGEVDFFAALRERVGELTIERTARAAGGKRTFVLSGKTQGSVSPPSPFNGSARFRDPAGGPATWTGSLSVPFPGVPLTPLAGDDFTARLCPQLPLVRRCLPRRQPFYGSGSHSQPLALARLSSLR